MICDRVAILHRGKLVSCGELKDLLNDKVRDYEAVVQDLSSESREVLGKIAVYHVANEGEMLFHFETEEGVDKLMECVMKDKARLISLTPRRDSLEEFFIRKVSDKETMLII